MDQLELLGSASVEKCFNTLPNIRRVFLFFEQQQSARRNSDTLSHRNDGVETRDFLRPFYVAPVIAGYVASFSSFF